MKQLIIPSHFKRLRTAIGADAKILRQINDCRLRILDQIERDGKSLTVATQH